MKMALLANKKGEPRLTISRCCCLSLKTSALIVVAAETLFILITIVFLAIAKAMMPGFPINLSRFVVLELELLIQLIMSCVLLYGILKKRRELVRAWVWVRGVCFVTEFLMGTVFIFVIQLWNVGLVLLLLSLIAFGNMLLIRSFGFHMQQREPGGESEVVSVEDLVKTTPDSK
ncbi:uncharacterized protein LOC122252295 [Penaeus japonicus]|uniref:uncharacterized protein LOC122252295 n=1 Tax=Penaeus japonicus TaxID=27405 RepID=UPI001C7100EE|nr:uncharacterized protein LOC122252295 [Penaeus japonicus]